MVKLANQGRFGYLRVTAHIISQPCGVDKRFDISVRNTHADIMQRRHQVDVDLTCTEFFHLVPKQLIRNVRHAQCMQKRVIGERRKRYKEFFEHLLKKDCVTCVPVRKIAIQFFQSAFKQKIIIRHWLSLIFIRWSKYRKNRSLQKSQQSSHSHFG